MTRILLSIRLGVVGGIIWGLFFTAYYSMLNNFEFAWKSASLCFALLLMAIFLIHAFGEEMKRKQDDKEDEEEEEEEDQ